MIQLTTSKSSLFLVISIHKADTKKKWCSSRCLIFLNILSSSNSSKSLVSQCQKKTMHFTTNISLYWQHWKMKWIPICTVVISITYMYFMHCSDCWLLISKHNESEWLPPTNKLSESSYSHMEQMPSFIDKIETNSLKFNSPCRWNNDASLASSHLKFS